VYCELEGSRGETVYLLPSRRMNPSMPTWWRRWLERAVTAVELAVGTR
jgi:hypothetical protein